MHLRWKRCLCMLLLFSLQISWSHDLICPFFRWNVSRCQCKNAIVMSQLFNFHSRLEESQTIEQRKPHRPSFATLPISLTFATAHSIPIRKHQFPADPSFRYPNLAPLLGQRMNDTMTAIVKRHHRTKHLLLLLYLTRLDNPYT